MKTKTRNPKQTKEEHDFEVAIRMWDDYHRRTAEFTKRLRVDIESLCKCFDIDEITLRDAKEHSRKVIHETCGRIV